MVAAIPKKRAAKLLEGVSFLLLTVGDQQGCQFKDGVVYDSHSATVSKEGRSAIC